MIHKSVRTFLPRPHLVNRYPVQDNCGVEGSILGCFIFNALTNTRHQQLYIVHFKCRSYFWNFVK